MTHAQRAALQRLTEKASPGPWDVDWNGPLTAVHASDGSGKHVAKAATVADAAFIAAAREAVPELLDALDAAEAESKRLQYACDGAYAQAVTTGEHLDEAEARVETLEAALRAIAGNDPAGYEGFHNVGDERAPDECPGCIARAALGDVVSGAPDETVP